MDKCHYCNGDLLPEDMYQIEEAQFGWHVSCYSCLSDNGSKLLPEYKRDPECPSLSQQEYEAMTIAERHAAQASWEQTLKSEWDENGLMHFLDREREDNLSEELFG